MESGKVKWYDPVKGFGFIETERGNDIFVHRTGLDSELGNPEEGQEVEFEIEEGPKGLFATNVRSL